MAIDYTGIRRTFGQATGFTDNAKTNDKPEAQVYLNIGFTTDDPQYPFVSLPLGIALDTIEPIQVRGQDPKFLAFTGARNDLIAQLKEVGDALEAGEEVIWPLDNGLAIQIRRRSEKSEAPTADNNPLVRKLKLFAE